jgi:polysaccharide export outer membrane protein
MRILRAAVAAAALAAAGCASTPALVGSEQVVVTNASELPPPSDARPDGAFVLGPLDKVKIAVIGMEDLAHEFQLDASGRLTFPYAGTINANGLTPGELAERIEAGLRTGHFRNPQVSVNLEETVSRTVTVDGEVEEPGLYQIPNDMTLMRSVARAGGLTEFAQTRHVVIFRTVGSQEMAALYDLAAIRQGLSRDPKVYPNDVVVVGTSRARRLFRDLIQGSGLLITPIVALLQRR